MKSTTDNHAAPIRSYKEIAEILRYNGLRATEKSVEAAHRNAIRKLRRLLKGEVA